MDGDAQGTKVTFIQFLAFSEALGCSTSSLGSRDRASKFILWMANTISGTVFAARHGLLPLMGHGLMWLSNRIPTNQPAARVQGTDCIVDVDLPRIRSFIRIL